MVDWTLIMPSFGLIGCCGLQKMYGKMYGTMYGTMYDEVLGIVGRGLPTDMLFTALEVTMAYQYYTLYQKYCVDGAVEYLIITSWIGRPRNITFLLK